MVCVGTVVSSQPGTGHRPGPQIGGFGTAIHGLGRLGEASGQGLSGPPQQGRAHGHWLAADGQGVGDIPGHQRRPVLREFRQPAQQGGQPVPIAGGHDQQLGRLPGGYRRGLFGFLQHQMHVAATQSERADPGPSRQRLPHRIGQPVPRPGAVDHRKRRVGKIDQRIELLEMQAGRQHAMLQRQHRLQQAGDPGCRFQMADIGLHRAQQAGRTRNRARGGGGGEGFLQRHDLHRIAQFGAGAMCLHIADRVGRNPRPTQRGGDQRRLGGAVGRGQGVGMAAMIFRRSQDHRMDDVAIRLRLGQRLQQDDPDALALHITVRPRIETVAAAGWRHHTEFHGADDGFRGQNQADSAGQRHFALAGLQRAHRPVHRHQRTGAGRVDRLAGAAQVEQIGNPVRQHGRDVAQRDLCAGGVAIRNDGPVFIDLRAEEHAHRAAGQAAHCQPGIFDAVPNGLDRQPVLRV